jgi:hypothetical protein
MMSSGWTSEGFEDVGEIRTQVYPSNDGRLLKSSSAEVTTNEKRPMITFVSFITELRTSTVK